MRALRPQHSTGQGSRAPGAGRGQPRRPERLRHGLDRGRQVLDRHGRKGRPAGADPELLRRADREPDIKTSHRPDPHQAPGPSTPTPRHRRSAPGGPGRTCRSTRPSPPRWAYHLRSSRSANVWAKRARSSTVTPAASSVRSRDNVRLRYSVRGQAGPLRLGVDGSDDVVRDVSGSGCRACLHLGDICR